MIKDSEKAPFFEVRKLEMEKFRIKLSELLNPYDHPRPFICDGNPMDCEVFIVGINAATKIDEDCWAFWSNDTGFNKNNWFENYIEHRKREPLKVGKLKRNKISNTRQRIEWLLETIKPIKTLETNLFVRPTATAKELLPEDKEIQVFKYLVQTIQPKVIFTHGKEVKVYMEKLTAKPILGNQVNDVELFGIKTKVIPTNHLSRGWSKEKTEEAGKMIKEIAGGLD